jgi:hypothetical protein
LDCLFLYFFWFSQVLTVEEKLQAMASLKVYGKAYSANVTRVLTTLAEKNVDDYQLVPIDIFNGANKTPEWKISFNAPACSGRERKGMRSRFRNREADYER